MFTLSEAIFALVPNLVDKLTEVYITNILVVEGNLGRLRSVWNTERTNYDTSRYDTYGNVVVKMR